MALVMTFWKFSNPIKPLIRPAFVILLTDILNTKKMGMIIKMDIRITLGAIQM